MLGSLSVLKWFYWHMESLSKLREECSPQALKPFLRVSSFLFQCRKTLKQQQRQGLWKNVREKRQQDRPQEDALNQMQVPPQKQVCRSCHLCVKSISIRWQAALSTAVFSGCATSALWHNSKTFPLTLTCNTQVIVSLWSLHTQRNWPSIFKMF